MAIYGNARTEAVGGNWLKLNNGDKWIGVITNCGDLREVHFDAKPPTPDKPNGEPARTMKCMVFEVWCETIERLGKPVEEVHDVRRFEPQVKWCVTLFDLIDKLEAAERNPQAIYGHRVAIQRVDKRIGVNNVGDLVVTDLGPLPANHPARPSAAPVAAPAYVPAPVIPTAPAMGGDPLAAFGAACNAATTIDALKAALKAAWPGLQAAAKSAEALAQFYNPRKQALLLASLNGAPDVASLTAAWNVAHAETERDPAMRAIVEAACSARNGALQGLGPQAQSDYSDDVPF